MQVRSTHMQYSGIGSRVVASAQPALDNYTNTCVEHFKISYLMLALP